MKKKKGTEDDRKLLPADVLAHKQKENTEGEDSLLLPAEVHTSKPNKRRSVEESVLLPDKRTPKKKEPRGADEGNRIPADVPTSKQKKKTREGKKQVAQAVGLSDQGKAKAEKEMEEENVLLPATGCTKKETMQEAGAVFPADRNSLKKRKKPEEKDDGVLPADVQRTKKMLEEETENRWVVLADVRKTKKKRREENTLPADGATDKHKKKKKEKERAQEEQENVLAADGFTKKKRRVEEEEKDSSLPPGFQVKKKKKKKRTEEEEVTMATEPTGNKKRSTSAPLVDAEIGRPPVTAGEAEESEDSDGVETGTTYDELLDPVLVAELEEFIPNVKKRSTDEIRKLLRYDLDRFRLFKEQGVSIRWGRFTQEENLRLQDNMAHFLAVTGIASADHLLFPHRYGDREAADVKKLKRRHGFLGAMAEGIPRPCKLVWSRALKLDDMNHMGQFSDEEVAQLLKLQKLHGNDWRSIAAKTGRSRYALQKRFAQIASGQGNWTAEEEGRLQEAVKAHLEAVSLQSCSASQDGLLNLQQLCTGLPWTDISQHVRTRCWTQCRIKWFGILQCRLSEKSPKNDGSTTLKTKLDLINTLYALNVEDARDVDWQTVATTVGAVTPLYSQKLFRRLKVCNVPDWTRLSYGEIIDFLQDRVAPRLVKQLRCNQDRAEDEAEQEVAPKDAYALFNIFASGEDDDDDLLEMDNTGPSRRRRL
ncbi:transcription termination factor 1-like isoform X2 [Vanacampus margaritifer]